MDVDVRRQLSGVSFLLTYPWVPGTKLGLLLVFAASSLYLLIHLASSPFHLVWLCVLGQVWVPLFLFFYIFSKLKKNNLFYAYGWYLCTMCVSVHRGQMRALYPLELELQVLWAAMWVLGPEPRSSVRATSAFNHWTIYLSSSWHCVFVENQPFICGLSSILGFPVSFNLLSFPSISYILEVKAKGLIQIKHFWQSISFFYLSFWDRASL